MGVIDMTSHKTPAVVPAVWIAGRPPNRRVVALITDGRLCEVAQCEPQLGRWSARYVTQPTHWAPIPRPPDRPWSTSWNVLYATEDDVNEQWGKPL